MSPPAPRIRQEPFRIQTEQAQQEPRAPSEQSYEGAAQIQPKRVLKQNQQRGTEQTLAKNVAKNRAWIGRSNAIVDLPPIPQPDPHDHSPAQQHRDLWTAD